jgi:hypothetical protein
LVSGADPKKWRFEMKTCSIFEGKNLERTGDRTNKFKLVGQMVGVVELDIAGGQALYSKVKLGEVSSSNHLSTT